MIKKLSGLLDDMLFPPRCPVCDGLLNPYDRVKADWGLGKKTLIGYRSSQAYIHPECMEKLQPIKSLTCLHCGSPVSSRKEYCYDCSKKAAGLGKSFRQGKSLFLYKGEVKETMYRFKYSNKREYASFFAKYAVEKYGDWFEEKGIEAVVAVPMYGPKKRLRGYNQAEVFARALAEELSWRIRDKHTSEREHQDSLEHKDGHEYRGLHAKKGAGVSEIRYLNNFVIRTRNTTPMKNLNEKERQINLENAFSIKKTPKMRKYFPDKGFQTNENIVQYSYILLVDDIYTTGSTADAVSEVMLRYGVKEVFFLSICIGQGY